MRLVFCFLFVLFLTVASWAATTYTTVRKTVTTAGTRVALVASATKTGSVLIMAECDNTGYIYLGDVTVSSTNGIRLSACEKVGVTYDYVAPPGYSNEINLNTFYIDSSVNGDGVNIFYNTTR